MKKEPLTHLFAYGTLMCEDIMEEVSGLRLEHVPGILCGYSRRAVKGEYYPAIMPDKEESVDGVLYRNVPASAWDRLDRFEGEMYERRSVRILLADGSTVFAAVYVTKPEFRGHLEAAKWDFDGFLKRGKILFQERYKGYQSL